MIRARKIVVVLLLLTIVAAAKRRDPLTDAEIDQLREAATQPNKRLRLFIKFANARLDSIQQLRSDPKAADGRGAKIHDLLEDFTAILDEINDNLDQYQGRPLDKDDRADFRDGLKAFVAATDGFDLKLKTLRAAIQTEPQARKDAQDFQYVLQDAEDALKSSLDIAREYLQANPAATKSPDKKK
jgi:hypothetical protein